MIILDTKRLILRTARSSDFEVLYEKVFSQKEVVKNTFGSQMFSYDEAVEFMKKNLTFQDKIGLAVLEEKSNSNIIGLAGVLRCDYLHKTDYETGFILEKNSWKKGYANEIGKAQLDFIKENLKHKRALALASPSNEASIKAIEKLGLEYLKKIDTTKGERLVYTKEFI